MKGRKATPNIMEELLNIKVSGSTEPSQKNSTPEYHNAGLLESQNTVMPDNRNTAKTESQNTVIPDNRNAVIPENPPTDTEEKDNLSPDNKAKATYYISQKLIEDIDQVWFDLRKLLKPSDRGKFSKSLLVELAVKAAIEDFRSNGKTSNLLQQIQNLTSD